jgi:hypothetical protein
MSTEETTTQEPATETPAAEPDERAELLAAVRAAKEEETGEKKTPERDQSGKFKPKPKPKAEPEPDGDEPPAAAAPEPEVDESTLPALARTIRQRERDQARRDELADLRASVERDRQEAAAERAAAKAEREAASKEAETARAQQARLHRLLTDPRAAAKELGWDEEKLQEFAGAAVAEGKPETVALRKLMERDAAREKEIAELRAWREAQEKTAQEREAQARQQHEAQQGEQAINDLLAIPSVEKTPSLMKVYGKRPQLFVAEAQRVAHEYSTRTGAFRNVPADAPRFASLPDIVEYLEHDAADMLGASSPAGEPPQQASGANGGAAKAKANGQRSLSAAAASERRASPKPVQDMDPDEERDFLVQQVKEARISGL